MNSAAILARARSIQIFIIWQAFTYDSSGVPTPESAVAPFKGWALAYQTKNALGDFVTLLAAIGKIEPY
jgi:hypothetical protein